MEANETIMLSVGRYHAMRWHTIYIRFISMYVSIHAAGVQMCLCISKASPQSDRRGAARRPSTHGQHTTLAAFPLLRLLALKQVGRPRCTRDTGNNSHDKSK